MRYLALLAILSVLSMVAIGPAYAEDATVQLLRHLQIAQTAPHLSAGDISKDSALRPAIPPPAKKQFFIGGGGVKHLGEQLVFPVRHPIKFANNCSHPIRHPLVAFRQFSEWAGPYNNGMSFASSAASIAGSAALQTLWSKHGL
jgi:hypothetical protein